MAIAIDLNDCRDVILVGGKAAWLGELLRAGLVVPKGFVVPANAKFPLNESDQEEILQHFKNKNLSVVAVRSSAVCEDGTKKSFAGQFDTYLNINRDNLIDKILAVHTSADAVRNSSYANSDNNSGIAVVIQEMVPSDISGVMFSANPLNNSVEEIVIEATKGLGERLVSGLVTPELYIINKQNAKVLTHEHGAESLSLNNSFIDTLVKNAVKIEKLAGCPMDIEWAIANNTVYILQARPITTLTKGQI